MKLGDSGGWLIEGLQMSVTMLGSDQIPLTINFVQLFISSKPIVWFLKSRSNSFFHSTNIY